MAATDNSTSFPQHTQRIRSFTGPITHKLIYTLVEADTRWARAFQKAISMKQRAWRLSPSSYRVRSTDRPLFHRQFLTGHSPLGGWECTCEAGSAYRPCWHLARVFLRLSREYRAPRLYDLAPTDNELFDDDEPVAEPPAVRHWVAPAKDKLATILGKEPATVLMTMPAVAAAKRPVTLLDFYND